VLAPAGRYFVWPSLVEVSGSDDELAAIGPWFAVLAVFELGNELLEHLLPTLSSGMR
jgi:hypothetical protein